MINPLGLAFDLVFSSFCVNCGSWVRSRENNICPECRLKMLRVRSACPLCGGALIDGECGICSSRKLYYARNFVLFEYEGCVKKALHGLKFRGLRNIYRNFIPEMADILRELPAVPDIVTFVPMSRSKMAERGYNQAALMAGAFAASAGAACLPLLRERRGFTSQRLLGNIDRYINVIDRYEVINVNKFMGRTILLVDDIFTTGATINECSRQLMIHGALQVFTFAVARAELAKAGEQDHVTRYIPLQEKRKK